MDIQDIGLDIYKLQQGSRHVITKNPWYHALWFCRHKDCGWLHVDKDRRGHVNVMWTSDEDGHSMLCGRARSITVDSGGKIVCYCESAISMWIKWGYGRGSEEDYENAVDFTKWVHGKLCGGDDE